MIKKTITDNSVEKLEIIWDGERFALSFRDNGESDGYSKHAKVIVLNIVEAGQVVDFIKEQIKHG